MVKRFLALTKKISHSPQSGFTLIEILIAIGVISVLTAITVPISRSLQTQNDLDIAVNYTAQAIRRAQVLSQAGERDAAWGVRLQNGNIIVFKGTNYAGRDQAFDESNPIANSITISGTTEYSFTKLSGTPNAAGSTTLTSVTNDNRTISVNAKGGVTY